MSKGQQAMALAMIYPEPKRGRGHKDEAKKALETRAFSRQRLEQARSVLRHSRTFAEQVLAGTMSLDEALPIWGSAQISAVPFFRGGAQLECKPPNPIRFPCFSCHASACVCCIPSAVP
jgi:hypothetical protein